MFERKFSTVGLGLAATFAGMLQVNAAQALTANGSSVIDWRGVSFVFSSGGAGAHFNEVSLASLLAPALFLDEVAANGDLTTLTEVTTVQSLPGFFDFTLEGHASVDEVGASFSLLSPQPPTTFYGTSSVAVGERTFSFAAVGNGLLTVHIPYTINLFTDALGIISSGTVGSSIERTRGPGNTSRSFTDNALTADLTGSASQTETSELVMAVPFLSGDVIRFSVFASVHGFGQQPAPVPLPPAALLLGTALLPLLARRAKV